MKSIITLWTLNCWFFPCCSQSSQLILKNVPDIDFWKSDGLEVYCYVLLFLKTLLTLNVLCISESYIEIKINLIFYFHASLWCSKCFMEAPQKSVKIKIWLNFFSSSGIRTSEVLILIMWTKWAQKHLREVGKNVFGWEKLSW